MRKEQEKAIENLTDLLKQRNEKQVQITTYNLFENIETVLSMLKQKDKEIEKLKQSLARNIANNFTISIKETEKSKEDLEMLDKGWQMELEKKDKQIDLMAEEINETDRGYIDYCQFKMVCDRNCKECIKQYFERKSEE